MNKLTHLIFGSYYPCISDRDMTRTCVEYVNSENFKSIRNEEQNYLIGKWQYLREFFEAEELAECIENANEQFYKMWSSQQRKIYYDKNAEKIRQQSKTLYERNKEKMHEKEKRYRDTHKEQVYERTKKYTELHKDEINEKHKIKVTCECGAQVRRDYLATHKRSIKHIEFLKNQTKGT